jgi:PAS domain S-box-containing protein
MQIIIEILKHEMDNDAIQIMDPDKTKTKKELLAELKALRKEHDALATSNRKTATSPEMRRPDTEFKHILDEIEDGYWETDLKGNHTYCNEAMSQITGFSIDELIGSSYRILCDDKTAELIYKHFNSVFNSETLRKTMIYDIIRKDKTERAVEISVSMIRSPSGKPTGFRGILRDVTDRYRAMDLEENFKMMRKALGQTVHALSLVLEVRDPYTAGHHRRVSDLARSIATQMNFTTHRIDGIRIAGSIHDIGKISIPSEILSKPGSLTDIEFKLVKQHPQMGYDILKNIDFPWPVALAVYQHHERLDGSGYPLGIKDKDILIEAKILAVADVVEAMASLRPYRRAIGIERALEEIKKNRNILYDADVVDNCVILFLEKGYQLKN